MTDEQRRTAEAIVNVFETGRARGRYGAVTVLKGDTGHLSYGRSQSALGSGSLYLLLKAYCEAPGGRFAPQFAGALLERFRQKDFTLDFDAGVRDLLEQAGEDPVMQRTQDEFFDRGYWQPATRAAAACGLTLPLSVAVVYDGHIQGGFARIRDRVPFGRAVSAAADEKKWIESYLAERRAWLNAANPPLPNTVYRVDEFSKLTADKWDLALPLRVRGVVIDAEVLGAPETAIVPARAPDPDASRPILQLTRPYMKSDDVKALQLALRDHGFSGDIDSTFGPMTDVLVKQFQRKHNLKDDGVVGAATWAELKDAAAAAAA